MSSSQKYLLYILDQLDDLEDVTYRPMMDEFLLYYRGKLIGGIYDDRFLVKPIKSAKEYMLSPVYEVPYPGAKNMLLVDDVEDKDYLSGLLKAMYEELPERK